MEISAQVLGKSIHIDVVRLPGWPRFAMVLTHSQAASCASRRDWSASQAWWALPSPVARRALAKTSDLVQPCEMACSLNLTTPAETASQWQLQRLMRYQIKTTVGLHVPPASTQRGLQYCFDKGSVRYLSWNRRSISGYEFRIAFKQHSVVEANATTTKAAIGNQTTHRCGRHGTTHSNQKNSCTTQTHMMTTMHMNGHQQT